MDKKGLLLISFILLIISSVSALPLGNNTWAEFYASDIREDSITWVWNNTLLSNVTVYLNDELKYPYYTGSAYTVAELDGGKTYVLRLERIADMYIDTEVTPKTSEQKTQDLIYWYFWGVLGLIVLLVGCVVKAPIIRWFAVVIITIGFILVTNERLFSDTGYINNWHLLIYGMEMAASFVVAAAGGGE